MVLRFADGTGSLTLVFSRPKAWKCLGGSHRSRQPGRVKMQGQVLLAVLGLALSHVALGEETGAVVATTADNNFSIPAFIICVREALEGCIIVAVLLNALHKSGQNHMKRWVWFGVIVSTVAFVVAGAIILTIFYTVGRNLPGPAKAAFEGVLAVIACVVLTHISLKFLRLKDMIMKWEQKLMKNSQEAGDAGKGAAAATADAPGGGCMATFLSCISDFRDALNIRHQALDRSRAEDENSDGLNWKELMLITFSAIFREGLETVIFLAPISSTTSETGLVRGACAGIAVGIAFGVFVLIVGKFVLLDPKWFFYATTLFIFFIAAGLSTYGMIEIEQIWYGDLRKRNDPFLLRPVYNIGCLHSVMGRVWTGVIDTHCLFPEYTGYDYFGRERVSNVGFIFRAMLGYRQSPTYLMCISYCTYWIVVLTIMMSRYKKGTLTSRFPGQHEALEDSSKQSSTEVMDTKISHGTATGVPMMATSMYPAPFMAGAVGVPLQSGQASMYPAPSMPGAVGVQLQSGQA